MVCGAMSKGPHMNDVELTAATPDARPDDPARIVDAEG